MALREIDLEELPIIGKQPESESEEKYLREIGEYEFMNLEDPKFALKFPYGNTKKKKNFLFFHSGRYKIPRHVALHVESCMTPMWDWLPDGTGKMIKQMTGQKARFQMRPVFKR